MGDSASRIAEKISRNPRYVNFLLKKMGYIEGSPGNYYLTEKGKKHAIVKGRSYFLWDEYAVNDIVRGQLLKAAGVKIGHVISYLKEIAFIGVASFLIFTFALRINPGILIKTAQGPMSHIKCSSIYLLCSLVAYPLLILISWLYQKALGFYNDEYKRITLFSVLGIDIYRDALFPFGLLFAPNENISKHLLIALIVKIIYFLIIWATPVLFVIVAARRMM